ncbi:hypothetical protein Tco_0884609 [Tanacetum coccineum]
MTSFHLFELDREGQVSRIRHKEEIDVHEYQILTHEILTTFKASEEIILENIFCLGGNRLNKSERLERILAREEGEGGRHSTSSSSTFDQPSSSHLNDDDDGNDEGTSRASTPSPICYVNSLTNEVPQVFQNPPNIKPHWNLFHRQTVYHQSSSSKIEMASLVD